MLHVIHRSEMEDHMYANNLFNYFNDGRPAQIQAVLAYISAQDGLETSWEERALRAEPAVGHWD